MQRPPGGHPTFMTTHTPSMPATLH